jgi:hypothetical protein
MRSRGSQTAMKLTALRSGCPLSQDYLDIFRTMCYCLRARDSVVVEALCYRAEGRGFKTRRGELMFSIYLILPAALGPGVYSASNRNEFQKQKNNVSGE